MSKSQLNACFGLGRQPGSWLFEPNGASRYRLVQRDGEALLVSVNEADGRGEREDAARWVKVHLLANEPLAD